MIKYKQTGMGNEILEHKTFFISFKKGGTALIPIWEADGKSDETALVKGSNYYILNGDFRKEYAKLKSWKSAYAFFLKKAKKYKSSWSD